MNTGTGRANWHLRANAFVILYLLAALIAGITQKGVAGGQPSWLTIHLLLLGATTNAIITWSDHFVSALLWARSHDRRRQMTVVLSLNIGIIGVLIAVSTHIGWLIIASATVISVITIFYLCGITIAVKQSINKRFAEVIHYYQSAGLLILVGIVFGVIDAFKSDEDPWQARIALAHLHANLLGWVGLTIIGTLVTLWPTVLRTQIHARAVSSAAVGLKFLIAGVIGAIFAALIDQSILFAISIVLYLLGAIITLAPAALLMRTKQPDRASSWMLLTGALGLAFALIGDIIIILTHHSPEKTLTAIEDHLLLIFTLWLLPTLLGSLIHLLPVVLGRGPTANKELTALMNRGWKWRLFLLPVASLLLLLPSVFHTAGALLAMFALGMFLVLTFRTMWRARQFALKTFPIHQNMS